METKLPTYHSVLLVAGTGRNSGKTTFITTICKEFTDEPKPVYIKISNHFHEQFGSVSLFSNPYFRIFEETQAGSQKDSARMLGAGASRSFFIEANEEHVFLAFKYLVDIISENIPIICESGSLRNFLIPGVFVILHTNGTAPKPSTVDLYPFADKILVSDLGNLQIPNNFLNFNNKKWSIIR